MKTADKTKGLGASAAATGATALLLVDVINDLEFDDGEELLKLGVPAAINLRNLKQRFRSHDLPVIYANDNFGKWKSDFRAQFEHCVGDDTRGKPIAELLAPEPADYFVLKPKHSAFYGTTLELLLQALEVKTLVVTGFATDICVLFSANDAYMRDYKVCVPPDCVAANTQERSDEAVSLMQRVLKADVRSASELDVSVVQ
ncbi:cysteine hydrolase family protein [Allorhodopirellula solitaria]|uniref:Isochorismatase family protein YecD n=1 Tax=Allorhodopirellula solitaria TaxID=2527987 RepID=A0A5C5X0K7_9BACT|nr:isochorismatase family cysteine hydrolase [Allorhodopirellula solitaria]TWT56486.1 Isochorismatase family protein YecD [Allorhodopirellula solitaria]